MDSDSDSDFKSKLASEICSLSARSVSCTHRHCSAPFVDWYRLLEVEEDAPIHSIRRAYLKLALLLHPDKNSHPNAQFAFNLLSQGYGCLSDNVKRRVFDLDRMNKFCPHCNTIPYTNLNSPTNPFNNNILGNSNLKDLRERFREEANVIENCLRANDCNSAATIPACNFFNNTNCRFHLRNHRESPIFNPSDYVSQGYPHFQSRIHPKPQSFRCFRSGNSLVCEHAGGKKFEYPVFEIRSENFVLQKQSAFVYSNVHKSLW